jgi:hypothetical protein
MTFSPRAASSEARAACRAFSIGVHSKPKGLPAMFTEIATLNGGTQLIRTDTIIRFRPSFGSFEPPDATVLDYANKRFYSADSPEAIVEKIGAGLAIAALTTPNDLPLYVDAAKVIDIASPIPGHHHPRARSVIRLEPDIRAQVRETPNQAKRIISEALEERADAVS